MPLSTNSHFNITNIDTIKLVLGQSGQLEGNGAFSLLCSLKRGSLNIYEPDVWKASIGDGKQTWKLLDPLNIQDKLLLGIALFVFTCLELLHSLGMLFGCPGWFFGQRRPPLEFPCFFLFFFYFHPPWMKNPKFPQKLDWYGCQCEICRFPSPVSMLSGRGVFLCHLLCWQNSMDESPSSEPSNKP